jgi:hypothetical protein
VPKGRTIKELNISSALWNYFVEFQSSSSNSALE